MRTHFRLAGWLFLFAAVLVGYAQEQPVEPPPSVTSTLVIEEGVICTGVEDRVPLGASETFPPDVGRLYCFTKIVGASSDMVVKHLWYREDGLLHTQELAVGGSPWRTWSNKTITPDMSGAWKVEIRDGDDNLITTLKFTVQ